MNPLILIFIYGLLGSAVVEVITLVRYYEGAGKLPSRYSKVGFWIVRVLLACCGGAIAAAYHPENVVLAVHIGASTPLLVATFAKALPGK